VWSFDWEPYGYESHEPELLPTTTSDLTLNRSGCGDRPKNRQDGLASITDLGEVIRDANRLPNRNTLIVEEDQDHRVTHAGEVDVSSSG